MKKKKVFSYLFLGLLTVGATGTVTSCKDYDDDINAANKRIDDVNTALEACKKNCNDQIASLKSTLESQDAYAKNLNTALQALQGTVSANSSDIATLKSGLQTTETTLKGLIDQNTTDIATNAGNIKTNAENLADLTKKVNANETSISGLISQLEEVDKAIKENASAIATNAENISKANSAISTNAGNITNNANAIKALQGQVETILADLKNAQEQGTQNAKDIKAAQEVLASVQNDVKELQNSVKALQETVANNSSLIATNSSKIAEAEKNINEILPRLEAAEKKGSDNAELIASAQKAIKDAQDALAKEIEDRAAAVASATARIDKLETTVQEIQGVLDNKVDAEEYNATIADIKAKLTAVNATLAEDLDKINGNTEAITKLNTDLSSLATNVTILKEALDLQKTTLETFKEEVAQKYATVESLNSKISTVNGEIEKLQNQINKLGIDNIDGLQNALDGKANLADFNTVKSIANTNSEAIDKINTQLNVINVFVNKALRSLVFIPDAYYWGIEAAYMHSLDYKKYTVPAANADKEETVGATASSTGHGDRYPSTDASRQLTLALNYHMNPSSADLSKLTASNFTILSADKAFTRAGAPEFTVKGFNVDGGDLTVNVDVKNDASVKNTAGQDNGQVTVVATQVRLNTTEGGDTTVTSDYAAIKREKISNLKLAHTTWKDEQGQGYTGVANTHDTKALTGEDADHKNAGYLMQTLGEAKTSFKPQDQVLWNSSIDLANLVEVQYENEAGEERLLSAGEMAANGLSYKFEMTGCYFGKNNTSESAHAAIPNGGSTFRPQMPNEDGTSKAFSESNAQGRQEIGRTPIVRVELVDADGNVLDYGYIRIQIVDKINTPGEPAHVSYTGGGWTYNGECVPADYSFATTWNKTEYDLYTIADMSREEFEKAYKVVGSSDEFAQFKKNKDGSYTKIVAPYTDKIGHIFERDETSPETGTLTHVLEWQISGTEMKKHYIDEASTEPLTTYICYERIGGTSDQNIYVQFTVGTPITNNVPAGLVQDDQKISNYWYASNTQSEGTAEIHANTLTPEDNEGNTANVLDDQFSNLFQGNLAGAAPLIKVTNDLTKGKEYATDNLTLDFVFDKAGNEGKPYQGLYNGEQKTFYLHVADDGKTLQAYTSEKNKDYQTIAKITGTSAANEKVAYVANADHNGYSEALLNYQKANKLDDQTLKAVIGVVAQNQCSKYLPLSNATFDVRFLRPINIIDNEKSITDAKNSLQSIDITELVKFSDWRNYWEGVAAPNGAKYTVGGTYEKYYGITSIELTDLDDKDNLYSNPKVMTNLGGSWKKLSEVSKEVQFTYNKTENKLYYRNLSSTLRTFQVKIPVTVTYIWGKVYTTVTVTVNSTDYAKKY